MIMWLWRGNLYKILLLIFMHSYSIILQAFGAPFIVAHVDGKKERFFGSDRMELLAHTLGK